MPEVSVAQWELDRHRFRHAQERLRKSHDYSFGVLGNRAGVDKATVWRIEQGIAPSYPTAAKIARALGTSVEAMIA